MSLNSSKYEKFNPTLLYKISKLLIDSGFYAGKDVYDTEFYDDNISIMNDVLVPMGFGDGYDIDYEFFVIFILENNNKIQNKQLDFTIPNSKKYLVDYTVRGSAYVIENYEKRTWSYSKELAKDKLQFFYEEGSFDYWEGDRINTEYEDFDIHHFTIDAATLMKENKNNSPILEQTQNTIKMLDKQTLESLKDLIDKRLKEL
jgi:hypothetical protein